MIGFFFSFIILFPLLTLTLQKQQQQRQQPSSQLFKHVVVIGLDGLAVDPFINAMDHQQKAPTLKYLRDNGVYTYNARSVFPTVSYPNWNSILTGTETSFHGIDSNLYRKENPSVVSVEGPCRELPNIFSLLKSYDSSAVVGAFYAWDTIGEILKPLEYLNASVNTLNDEESTLKTIEFLHQKKKPKLTFLYLSDIDDAGHGYGFNSKEDMDAIQKSDERVGQIIDTLHQVEMINDTLILIVTDHGRKLPRGQYHGSFTDSELRTTWIAFNSNDKEKKLKSGHELQMPLMNSDTAPTVLYALGVNGGVMPVQMRSRPILEIYQGVDVYSGQTVSSKKGSAGLWKYTETKQDWDDYQQCMQDFHLKLSPLWGNWDLASYSAGVIVGVLGTLLAIVVLLFIVVVCACCWMSYKQQSKSKRMFSWNASRNHQERKGYVAVVDGGSEGN